MNTEFSKSAQSFSKYDFWSVNFLKLCVFGMICQQTNVGTYLIWSSVWPVSVLKYYIITHSHTSSYYLLLVKDTIVLGCDQSKWNMYPTILICHYKSISYLHLHLSFNHLNFFGKETFETKKYICKRRNLIYVHYPFIFGLIFFRLVKLQCTLLCKGATQQLCETWRPERKIHSAVLTPVDSNSYEI